MKSKPSLIQIMASVRKIGGRATVAIASKKSKERYDRHAWKRERE